MKRQQLRQQYLSSLPEVEQRETWGHAEAARERQALALSNSGHQTPEQAAANAVVTLQSHHLPSPLRESATDAAAQALVRREP